MKQIQNDCPGYTARPFIWTVIAAVVFMPSRLLGAELHVPAQYPHIQSAINAAVDGDVVCVADGMYTGFGNRDVNFLGKAITVQSEQGPDFCVIDCQGTASDNHRAFLFTSGETNASQLVGFTIIHSYQSNYSAQGGAILITGSAPLLSQCRFETNVTEDKGGAIYAQTASGLIIQNCVFTTNTAVFSLGGSAIYATESSVEVSECTFTENVISGYQGQGGCVAGFNNTLMVVRDSVFTANETTGDWSVAGAIMSCNSNALITGCLFDGNVSSVHSGSIDVRGSAEIDCCTFTGNRAGQRGGAVYFQEDSTGSVTGCTFENNIATLGGAICFSQSSIVIGGSVGDANVFTDNFAETGADIACLFLPDPPINAQYNHFTGYYLSDYYVSPSSAFDLSHCTYIREPIRQDVYVTPDGSDTNDGLTWETAFRTVRHAVSLIYATETLPLRIHIGSGRFSPSTTGELFPLPVINHVSIRGVSRIQTVLDAESTGGIFFLYRDDTVTIEDMGLTGGLAARGGAIYCHQCDPLIQRCDIHHNTAGLYRAEGGAIYSHKANPVISQCTIASNQASYGGGLFLYRSLSHVVDCLIEFNQSENLGGGMYSEFAEEPSMTFTCVFRNNTSHGGGGLYCYSSDHDFINCLFVENAAQYGAGINGFVVSTGLTLINCTCTGNTASQYGGAYSGGKIADPVITNCIFWNNSPDELHGIPPIITYSLITGGFPGTGNIDADPLFVSGLPGEYCLSHIAAGQAQDSPCIDAGSDLAEVICAVHPLFDPVCLNELTTRTDGVADTGLVDMGFHSMVICSHTGDVNLNGDITASDSQLAFMAALGMIPQTIREACAADCNGDGMVTAGDAQAIFMVVLGMTTCDDPMVE
ncbi:hypothetical protein JXA80_04040 [bacterium]|nr:hypothetical protein [candidate division CSSED10-310 bacterium]